MSDIWNRVTKGATELLEFEIERMRAHPDIQRCGSEIERAFAIAMIMAVRLAGGTIVLSRERLPGEREFAYFLEPQVNIGKYRVDFLFGFGRDVGTLSKQLVVECDGHEWHERTKEQAAADKARDRYLHGQVAKVLRFTGSEIFADPDRCAREAAGILHVVSP